MKLSFYGATRTTTGSKHLLEVNGRRVLLECGMFQGRRKKALEYNSKLPFDPASVDALLLSHAHIDHSGLIPVLGNQGFAGPIYATAATVDLCEIMLLDSAHIQEQDAAFVSKKRAKKGEPPVTPLYTEADAESCLAQFRAVDYRRAVEVTEGVTATWLDAGHILGSSMIVLDIQENGTSSRLVFSGDLGRPGHDILRDPEHPQDVDYLLVESTYGNRRHEPVGDVNEQVCRMIARTIDRQGKIVIPAFSVGRTQRLLEALHQLMMEGCIPPIPIYVDSPLSSRATEVFRRHPECFNHKFYEVMLNENNPFSMTNLTYTTSVAESMALNDHDGPMIIISASGMAEAGRIRHHIKNTIGDGRNLILIVGWCAPHTLGSRLASGHKEVRIFGEPYPVRAAVETIDAFSGHADQDELQAWVSQVSGPLRGIRIVHGEAEPALAFGETLRGMHPRSDIAVPEFGDSVEWC